MKNMSKFVESSEEFQKRKQLFKDTIFQNCSEKDAYIIEDSDDTLTIKMLATCRRASYGNLHRNFSKTFTTYIQGYQGAEGHQPVVEITRKEKPSSSYCNIV